MDLYFGEPDYTPEQVPHRMKDFIFDQYHLVVGEKCIKFMDALYAHDYEMDYHYAHDRESATKEQVATAGLALMFNTKWLTEPAFVDWKDMSYVVYLMDMDTLKDYFVLNKFIELIDDPKIKIAIIKHLLKFYFPKNRDLNLLLERELIAANYPITDRRNTPNINIGSQTNYIGCTIHNGLQTDAAPAAGQECNSDAAAAPAQEKNMDGILELPRKNKYSKVREYIKERSRFDAEFKQRVEESSRVELCMYLTELFGWDVDPHHLGVNMNRNR